MLLLCAVSDITAPLACFVLMLLPYVVATFMDAFGYACSHGRSGMLWVFPPFHLIGAVINKLLVEQTNAIVILPRFLRFWTAMLEQLPVFAIHELSYYSKLYTIGSGAPKYMQGQGKDKPIYLFTAYLVTFS